MEVLWPLSQPLKSPGNLLIYDLFFENLLMNNFCQQKVVIKGHWKWEEMVSIDGDNQMMSAIRYHSYTVVLTLPQYYCFYIFNKIPSIL